LQWYSGVQSYRAVVAAVAEASSSSRQLQWCSLEFRNTELSSSSSSTHQLQWYSLEFRVPEQQEYKFKTLEQ
jgi:hypothetical protein